MSAFVASITGSAGSAAAAQLAAAAKAAAQAAAIEAAKRLGFILKPPKCTDPELIDKPKDDGIMMESATATYQAITTADAMFGYLHVDTTIPSAAAALAAAATSAATAALGGTASSTGTPAITLPDYLIESKNNIWKLSIVSGASVLIMSALYAKLK